MVPQLLHQDALSAQSKPDASRRGGIFTEPRDRLMMLLIAAVMQVYVIRSSIQQFLSKLAFTQEMSQDFWMEGWQSEGMAPQRS